MLSNFLLIVLILVSEVIICYFDNDLGNYEETLRSNRLNLIFNKHFIDGEKTPDVKTLYVTAEERAVAEDKEWHQRRDEVCQTK